MDGVIQVQFLPVSDHLREVMAEVDEDIAKRLIGSKIFFLLLFGLAHNATFGCHAVAGPEANFIKLDPLDCSVINGPTPPSPQCR